MSTTVTYKGDTLTTVNNQTRTLNTSGKYLEDDITLVDVTTTPTGTLSINENGTYDVAAYGQAVVNVSGGGDSHYSKATSEIDKSIMSINVSASEVIS